jgi:Domain of unknown function (DUF4129)
MPRGWRRLLPSQTATAAVAAVAVLCAVATIGLQARAAFPISVGTSTARLTGPALDDLFGLMAGAGDVALIALLVLLFRRRRKRKQGGDGNSLEAELPETSRWTKILILLYPVAVFAIPILLLSRHLRHKLVPLELPGLSRAAQQAAQHAGRAATGSSWPVLTGIVLAIAVVTAIVVLERRHGSYRRPARLRRPTLRPSPLRSALSAGAAALREGTEPRAAIIGCYAAMERALAGAGAAPSAADTPAEVLDRAAAGGLIHSSAADDLTGLFRQARYGGHDIGEPERAAAQGALARLQSDLADPS